VSTLHQFSQNSHQSKDLSQVCQIIHSPLICIDLDCHDSLIILVQHVMLIYRYALPNFQFGKVDLGRFPALGEKFRISDSAFSRQLPTLILFRNGAPQKMRPTADAKGKLIKFHMNMESIVTEFDLNNLHNELKAEASKNSSKHAKSD